MARNREKDYNQEHDHRIDQLKEITGCKTDTEFREMFGISQSTNLSRLRRKGFSTVNNIIIDRLIKEILK